jgi:hypothetical protein
VIEAIKTRLNTNDSSDALRFFHMDTSNHLIVQRVVLVPAVIRLESESPVDRGNMALASLNPFKATVQSQDHATSPDDCEESCRILLQDLLDVGELNLDQSLQGIQVCFTKERIRGVAWSDTALYVSEIWMSWQRPQKVFRVSSMLHRDSSSISWAPLTRS